MTSTNRSPPPVKNLHKHSYTTKEVIEVQSKLYYSHAPSLGFRTLAQENTRYASQIAQLVFEFHKLAGDDRELSFVELGPGTGVFFERVTAKLTSQGISHSYKMVDVASNVKKRFKPLLDNHSHLRVEESSFDSYALNTKDRPDILIMNEALDMWAGPDFVLDEWGDEQLSSKPFWVLRDQRNDSLVRKGKEPREISGHHFWEQWFYNPDSSTPLTHQVAEGQPKLGIPESLGRLLSRTRLFTVVQDYWSYGYEANPLRMGLTKATLRSVVSQLSEYYPAQHTPSEVSEDGEWIPSQVIPYGSVDVTHSPDQDSFVNLVEQLGLQATTIQTKMTGPGTDPLAAPQQEKTGEILLVYGKEALEEHLHLRLS